MQPPSSPRSPPPLPSSFFPDARLIRSHTLPTIPSRVHHYVNLTNGLEAAPHLARHIPPASIHMCRFQSSHCEASRPDFLLRSVETSMLFQLARGHCVLVYDFGSRNKKRGAPRALWMGLEFIRYALDWVWYKKRRAVWVRGNNVAGEYDRLLKNLDSQTYKKIKYYRRYIPEGAGGERGEELGEELEPSEPSESTQPIECSESTDIDTPSRVQLFGVYANTVHDADDAYYAELGRQFDQILTDPNARREFSSSFESALATGEPFDRRYVGARCHPLEQVLGMRLFLGGIDPTTYDRYMNENLSSK